MKAKIKIVSLFLFFIFSISFAQNKKLISKLKVPDNWKDGYVIADDHRIHYWRTGGDKPVMVLAHGSSDNGLCWTCLVENLEQDYDIIMFDAIGHGLSDAPSKLDTPDAQVESLAGLIKALDLNKPILMGHSMGSASVAWFSARYPDVPRAVILEDPNLKNRTLEVFKTADSLSNQRFQKILKLNNKSYEELYALCLNKNKEWGDCECQYWAVSKLQHHPYTAKLSRSNRPAIQDLFTQIKAPTLILKADDQDDLRANNIEVTKLLINGEIEHITGAKHNVRRDQKQLLLEKLKAFLAKI